MKRFLVVALVVVAASLGYRFYGGEQTGTGTLTLPQPSPNRSDPAPLFEATNQDEEEQFELSEEGIYVLTFWSTLNRDTAEARPRFDQLARDYEDSGVSFAAVYVSYAPESAEDVPYAVLQDDSGELSGMYNVKRVPRLFLIRDGTIELVQNGFYEGNEEQLQEALEKILPPEEA